MSCESGMAQKKRFELGDFVTIQNTGEIIAMERSEVLGIKYTVKFGAYTHAFVGADDMVAMPDDETEVKE